MTISETDDEGQVKVFFELNGQPRIIWVRNRSAAVNVPARRKAEERNPSHIAAPMPGSVSTIAVKLGQEVKAGDVIATLEAMKMETALHAPHDGKIAEILVAPGQHIDARDLVDADRVAR
jgi:pyruvate carboxylase